MTPVQFEPEALDELDAVYCYYESLSPGLGDRLNIEGTGKALRHVRAP